MRVPSDVRIKTVTGATDLALAADAGESLLVLGIYVYNPASNYLTVKVDNTSVGYFRVGGTQGNHLFYPTDSDHRGNLLDLLRDLGLFSGIPIAEGQQLTFDGVAQSGAYQTVIYRKGAAGDYTSNMPNGSDSDKYLLLNYGRYSTTLVDGDNLYETAQTPVEFPGFPWGKTVPASKTIRIYGIAFSDVGKTSSSASNQHETQYLKLIKEREVLFDDDRNGLLCYGAASASTDGTYVAAGQSVLGNRSDADLSDPLIFDEPLVFGPNEELNVYVTTDVVAGSANLAAADAEVCLIQTVSPAGR